MIRILLVEDDCDLNEVICRHLSAYGYEATGCLCAQDAYDQLYGSHFDLILSDIMMKDIDGFEFAESVRAMDKQIPILFITAREDYSAKERGYRLGIDDYMVKPIDLNELNLRIAALLRRANISQQRKLVVGNLTMDEESMNATVDGEEIPMTLREFRVLYKLLSYPGRAFTRSQLMDEFTGIEKDTGLRTVDVYIATLRSKLSRCTGFKIITIYGMGYKAVLL